MSVNPMSLSGRRVLVTGASSGIGRDVSILLSELGASVVLVARRVDKLEETRARMTGNGHHVEPFDLSSPEVIPEWIKHVADQSGPLHGLVHSAGIQVTQPLRNLSYEQLQLVMRINFESAALLVKGFRQKGVCDPGGASVVLLASIMALVGQPGIAVYAASKGALVALAKSLALELARDRIRINCVAPGHVRTEMADKLHEKLTPDQVSAIEKMHPLGFGQPRDVSHAVAFLLAETGRWITGTVLVVDGGYTTH